MNNKLILTSIASALILAGCGDAETTINELPPVEMPEGEHDHGDGHDHDEDHDHDHDGDHGSEYEIESEGRLVVADAASNTLTVFDLDDDSTLDTFTTTYENSSISSSADYRYAVINSRSNGLTEFLDGGLWREDHVAHLHDYEEAPAMSDFTLEGSRPTHVTTYDGQLAVFYDGNADTSMPAGIKVVTDLDIANEQAEVPELEFTINMHGVGLPRGDMLVSSVRRDDAETVSSNPILPDSVAVYHWHDGEYEEEQRFDGACANLHGAAQNEHAVVFGCSDGVLILHEENEEFTSELISNIDALNGARVGRLYGYEHAEAFVGMASQDDVVTLLNVSPKTNSMSIIDWQPTAGAQPVAYSFTYDGDYFAILDDKGFVTLLEAHEENGDVHFEFAHQIDVASASASSLSEGQMFSMTASQHDSELYVVDPAAQAILEVDFETETVETEITLDFVPQSAVWLGIAEEHAHEEDGEHNH